MPPPPPSPGPDAATVAAAGRAAEAAAARAGITLREAAEGGELGVVRRVFDTVWAAEPTNPVVTVELLRAYAHTGQYVVVALDDASAEPFPGNVVAASVGFLAEPIGRALHSNVTGVLPAGLGRSIGFAIKLHQRTWALSRGLDLITWTFDPLIRRNAWFNLAKLAARPHHYLSDFYGEMADGINAGDPSDRLYLRWELTSAAVSAACGGRPAVSRSPGPGEGGRWLLAVDAGGGPVRPSAHGAGRGDGSGSLPWYAQVPRDIEALRRADPVLARAWRLALREVLGGALAAGWQVTGICRDGAYVLEER